MGHNGSHRCRRRLGAIDLMAISRSQMSRQVSRPPQKKRKVKKKTRDPKVGTGKKPKGSGRRLYTDENPRDTVRIKFATPADARATVAKVKKIKKPFARKIQILTVAEQRAKVMGKNEVVRIFRKGKEAIRDGTKSTKKAKG